MEAANPGKYDLVVVGGGPAGSTLAALVARQGHRVLLLEKERFPRYQIGESLLPATVLGICNLLGVTEELEKANFVEKRGGVFRWGSNPEPWIFAFIDALPSATEETVSYQVERMKFDDILLKNASRNGAVVQEECAVTQVISDSSRVTGVRYVDSAGHEQVAEATFVIDASGNKSRIHQGTTGIRQYSEFFRNIAVFGYFEGGKRLPAPHSGNVLTEAFGNGWFWYIPLSDTLTSVGAVVPQELADKVQGDRERALLNLISESPMVSDFLADATLVREGTYGRIRVRKDYSYCSTKFWQPGMALVGDSACFIDPVLSTGVHLATYSALLAARSVNSVLSGQLEEEVAFDEFEARYRREYANFYEFLVSFYDTHADESSYFWNARKVTKHSTTDMEAFVSLVGGVSSGEDILVGAGPAATPDGKQAAPEDPDAYIRFDPYEAEWGTSRWIPGNAEAVAAQNRAGLVPSADNLHWVHTG